MKEPRGKVCSTCGFFQKAGEHMARHDSYWCPQCDVWLDHIDCDCEEFCRDRPERPSMVQDRRSWREVFS